MSLLLEPIWYIVCHFILIFSHEKGFNIDVGAALDGGNLKVGRQHNAEYEVNFKKDVLEKFDLDAHSKKQVNTKYLGIYVTKKSEKICTEGWHRIT